MNTAKKLMFHWQNLTAQDKEGSFPWHGRTWLYFGKPCFKFEWSFGRPQLGFLFALDDDFENTVSFSISLLIVSLYFTIDGVFHRLIRMPGEFGLSFHKEYVRFDFWSELHSWNQSAPWWRKSHTIFAPWSWEIYRTSYLLKDGSWHHIYAKRGRDGLKILDEVKALPLLEEQHPYSYQRKNGEIQKRTATCKVEEREWRWRWFMWLPYIRMISRVVDYEFNDEVGERSGSWKGGVYASSEEMRPGETIEQCFRRMEATRKF